MMGIMVSGKATQDGVDVFSAYDGGYLIVESMRRADLFRYRTAIEKEGGIPFLYKNGQPYELPERKERS